MADDEQQAPVTPAVSEQNDDTERLPKESLVSADGQEETELTQEGDAGAVRGEHESRGVVEAQAEAEEKPPTPPKDKPPLSDATAHAEQQDGAPSGSSGTPAPSLPQTPAASSPVATIRHRTDSQSTTATTATNATRSTARSTRSSMVFVVTALESIAASKDARKRTALSDSAQQALSAIRNAQGDASQINPEVMFAPLNLATEATDVKVVTTALDCLGKLISYSYFSPPSPHDSADGGPVRPPLIERAIDTICDCFQGEATPAEVQMQIIKSLLAAILNDKIVVHGAGLLKSVRQTYNIFLLSKNSANQQIAQGTLTQMVNTVFERVKARLAAKTARANSSKGSIASAAVPEDKINGTDTPVNGAGDEMPTVIPEPETPAVADRAPMTLATFETRKSFDDATISDAAPTTVSRTKNQSHAKRQTRVESGADIPSIMVQTENGPEAMSEDDEEDEIYIKDAFLVFRAMCKLGTKPLRPEDAVDVKSQGMRSKLLSLHIIHTALFNHSIVFTSPQSTIKSSSNGEPTPFTKAINQYLCLSLSRNASSIQQKVFEVSAEIFYLIVRYLRPQMKRELEVFFREVYLAILEKRAAPWWQKSYIIQHVFGRIAAEPKALVEIYLNYDCDRQAQDNFYQRIIEHVSRIAGTPVNVSGIQQQAYLESQAKSNAGLNDWRDKGTLPPSLATANIGAGHDNQFHQGDVPPDYVLKVQSLEALVETLRSLVNWGQQGVTDLSGSGVLAEVDGRGSADDMRESLDTRGASTSDVDRLNSRSPAMTSLDGLPPDAVPGTAGTSVAEDDPAELEKIKQRKTALNNAIRHFNEKPKRGIKKLISEGFIPSSDPTDIARFMITNQQVNKKSLGEFLGEGDEENIKIMHAFVDQMDFTRTRFVDALRRFLQSFRLPGEAQKIDRLMLKFAERYTTGNPSAFANADTAYVLAYSVIMLNTDQHSAQVKKRMTAEDFIKNNRGINDSADLPEEYLTGIFDEIQHNEIVLDSERERAANLGQAPQAQQQGGLVGALANVGRDLQREAYVQASDEMSQRTEQLFKSILRQQKRGAGAAISMSKGQKFIVASNFRHVGAMFEATWMSFFTALSGSAQETQNLETIRLCMEGLKLGVRISCLFDLEDPRQAFVAALTRGTNLYNLSEMQSKNVEALKAVLEVALTQGNLLKESWRDVLITVSQLDRFQLISSGVEEGAVPDMLRTMTPNGSRASSVSSRQIGQSQRRPPARSTPTTGQYQNDIAEESRSANMIRLVDRIFTNTANLSGSAIVDFVRALTQVSWQEIQSSGQSDSPRTYSLQKLVEISGYNMLRVRFEWTNIWQVLGQHFIDVGCHNNTHVVYFALNSLRQLSMRFLELEELPGFKFQKDFLKPFELILSHTSQVAVKDMVLRCLIQMIQARGDMIRSGWRTMFGVFTVAAREPYESIVNLAYDNVTQVYNERFGVVISQGAFADLVVCLTEFSKNEKFQKKSLQAIETLKGSVPKMLRTPECPLSLRTGAEGGKMDEPSAPEGMAKQPSRQTTEEQFWFPVLFAFHDVLMTGEDLEVRSRALNYLFDTLTRFGGQFPQDFWDTLWRQLLYPIFMVLKDRKAVNQEAANHEELSVWLSTTLIQALRNMISLFTHFFEGLEYMLDRFLDLLALCICQENDTLARIGSNCLQQLILQNVKKFGPDHWERIVGAFIDLFARTEARELFSAATGGRYEGQRRESEGINGAEEAGNGLRINGLGEESGGKEVVNGATEHARPSSSDGLALDTNPSSPSPHTNPTPTSPPALEDFAAATPSKQQPPIPVTAARRRYFNQIITKCVLQLLMIETVSELFSNDSVYASIPSHLLLRLMGLLKRSYHFAKRFNEDKGLRGRLFREGFMRQPPNLLKQESGSASVYVGILVRMYNDPEVERAASRSETEAALIPLCQDIIASYISLDEETQQRNLVTWRPVVVDVLEGYNGFDDEAFGKHVEVFAPLAVQLMGKEMGMELQRAVQGLWGRVCEAKLGIKGVVPVSGVPASPSASLRQGTGGVGGRRVSRSR